MRIVSGRAKGRKLMSVPGDTTRPVLDRVKTALFDILRPEIRGMQVLDLFAGSGSVGIEALSQGAAGCTFVEIEAKAVYVIKKNLAAAGLEAQAEIKHTDAFAFLKKARAAYDLIYVAPPQYQTIWSQALQSIAERPELVKPGGLVIAQIDPREYEKLELTDFSEEQQRRYGSTLLVFYRRAC